MRLLKKNTLLLFAAAFSACSIGALGEDGNGNGMQMPDDPAKMPEPPPPPKPVVMTVLNYEQALRSAALKLTGNYPTLAEIQRLRDAGNQATEYAKLIDGYLARPAFANQMIDFWRDTFRMGGQQNLQGTTVEMDHATAYATMLVVKELPFSNIVTATQDTCQTFNGPTGDFTRVNCPNANAVGVLTDAGVQAQFFSAMAFRRVRWVQETFLCAKFPAETNGTPEKKTGGTYASPWPFASITGGLNTDKPKIDFQDDKSIVCANCHSTMNHLAPLFLNFGMNGRLAMNSQVKIPVPGEPTAQLRDFLPMGESTAYRFGKPVKDLKELGDAIAADPAFPRCMATRIWNWALSRPDVVEDQATLTEALATELATELVNNKWNMKALTYKVFTNESFVRF